MSFKVHTQILGLTLIGALSTNAALAGTVAVGKTINAQLSQNAESVVFTKKLPLFIQHDPFRLLFV